MKKCKLKNCEFIKDFNLDIFWEDSIKSYKKEVREKFKNQNKKYGFDDRETYDLSFSISLYIYTRLKLMLEVSKNIIDYDKEPEYKEDINKMLICFSNIINSKFIDVDMKSEKFKKEVEDGLEAFKRSFFRLWW